MRQIEVKTEETGTYGAVLARKGSSNTSCVCKKKILSRGARLSKLLQKIRRASGWMAKMNHFMQNIHRIIF